MTTPFRDYLLTEDDQAVLSAMARIWRAKLTNAAGSTKRLRQRLDEAQARLADAEALERESRDKLEAIAERREALHREAEAPDREALAASNLDITLADDGTHPELDDET